MVLKKMIGKHWIVHFSIIEKVDYEEIYNLSDDKIRKIVNDFFDKVSKTIKKVENKFLEHKTELLQMNNKT